MERCYKTFVSIGNAKNHFSRLLNAVDNNAEFLPKPILIQHGHTPFQSHHCDLIEFINMDQFIKHVQDAEILLLHAGAGSVLHSLNAGKCPIIMPRRAKFHEHVNDHQVDFATILSNEGKAMIIDNEAELRDAISKVKNFNAKLSGYNKSAASEIIKKKLAELLDI